MALRIERDAEPIPGYRLIEKLGSGGFGEVWKAEAPGGLFKAIKFVERDDNPQDACALGGSEPDRSRADQEWKSLLRVKTVRHPFILLLDRFENIDNFLVIVMELADRTLADRCKECRSQGLPGLPREELLGYMAEAAEVLDLMNSQYQLQHLDIKPQNLFLVHNHVKVADFGLVKDTTSGVKLMTITGGVTPVYAAPETFDGKFSRQSDQYSLAIVYQEMLTGHRPFTGTSMKQLILQHLQNAYDLTPSPVNDRPVLARALARNPEDRFATCSDLVQALKRASLLEGSPQGIGTPPPPPPPPSEKQFPSVSKTVGARGVAPPVKPAEPNFCVETAFLGADQARRALNDAATPPKTGEASEDLAHPTSPQGAQRRASKQPVAPESLGVVQPALVIGIGQLGVESLTQLRQRLATEFAGADSFPHLRLLAIDTNVSTIQQATAEVGRHSLRNHETLLARLQRPSHYLKTRDGKLPTDHWLNPKFLYRIPRDQNSAGLRALGRLAFVDNYRSIAKRLESELLACTAQDTPLDPSAYCDLGLRTAKPRVYIVSSLTGNTGSGMLLDVAYLARKLLNEQGHADAEIVGIFYLPVMRPEAASAAALGNAYASLIELHAFRQSDAVYAAAYETTSTAAGKSDGLLETGPAFQRCFLFSLPDTRGKLDPVANAAVTARAADFLYRDVATSLGQALDAQRLAKLASPCQESAPRETVLESISVNRIYWPRHAVLEQAARRLCSQLATRWMSKDASPFADTIRQWTHERWESLGMRPETLIERFQQMSEHSLQQTPEQMLAEILAPLQQTLSSVPSEAAKDKPPIINMGPVVACMDRLEKALGAPDEIRSGKQTQGKTAVMEQALADIAHVIADECEQKLAELAVTLLEDPNYRLAGAEEALRQFSTTVEQSLQSQEVLAKELAEKAARIGLRVQHLTEATISGPAVSKTPWTLGLSRRTAAPPTTAADLFELVRTYTKTRYHSLVLTHLNRLYVSLRGHLSDQIREVGFCRQRLGELFRILQPTIPPDNNAPKGERVLFPAGCLGFKDAIERVSQSVTTDDLVLLDNRVQEWIRTHCQALLQICMGSSTLVLNLAPAMLQEAESFLKERLDGTSVAEMYWTQKQRELEETTANMADDLLSCLDDAASEQDKPDAASELTLVSFPKDEHGAKLQQLLHERVPVAQTLFSERSDEIVFVHDITNIPWQDLPQLGPIARTLYEQRMAADPSALHCREDLSAW